MKKMSTLSVEALLLSDELAKLIEANRIASENERDTVLAIVEEGSVEAPIIDDGLYGLTVVSAVVGIREGPDRYNPEVIDAPIVHINMALNNTRDGEGNPIVLRSTMNLKFSRGGSYPPSTLFLYAKAFGVLPPQGSPFDTDWLVGQTAQGMIRTEEAGKWPKVINESLMPAKKGSTQKAPAVVSPVAPPPAIDPDDIPFSRDPEPPTPAAVAVGGYIPELLNAIANRHGQEAKIAALTVMARFYDTQIPAKLDAGQRAEYVAMLLARLDNVEHEHAGAYTAYGHPVCRICGCDVAEKDEAAPA